jgi:FlgD Ig-like domain/IPT/TIG domain
MTLHRFSSASWSLVLAMVWTGIAGAQNPLVRGFTPRSGPPGTLVKIIGQDLDQATQVLFAGTPAEFRVVGGTQLKAIVPEAARSGPIRVAVADYAATTAVPFEVVVDRPAIEFALAPPRPNPFAGAVAWSFSIPATERVRLRVIDLRGAMVRELAGGEREAGVHRGTWDGADHRGRPVTPGIYFLVFEAGGRSACQRVAYVGR